jgi:hypothetical protein
MRTKILFVIGGLGRNHAEKIVGTIEGISPHNYEVKRQKTVSFKIATQNAGNTTRYKEILLSGRKYWEGKLVL